MSGEGEGETLEYTPTWVVAAVCTVIVALSLAVERLLHYCGIFLRRKNQKPLYEALQKIKEELMLLGFISLLLTVSQNFIAKICVPENVVNDLLPCNLSDKRKQKKDLNPIPQLHIFKVSFLVPFLALLGVFWLKHQKPILVIVPKRTKVPLLSVEAIHHLHIFIFVLAIVHVTFCVLTILFGGAKIRQWKHWENEIANDLCDTEQVLKKKFTHVQQHTFIKEHFLGIGKNSSLRVWLNSFFKQFYASVTKSDYITLRLGFIMTHTKGNPKFNFHKYMVRALEDDFKTVVGIRQLVSLGFRGHLLIAEYPWYAH
ncbi:hypothetical protein OIU85_004633 [Salix viminalis]|uniref:MLO-like protein n=1 Tax=Salix viminalis TaxID=40686 RepID=A0A9Q0PSX0_SALVM|nr:hypothetical protein OIU85_004633 [Salix viminalis]